MTEGVVERDRPAVPDGELRDACLVERDLAGADLAGRDLGGADLCRADLSGAKLIGARLVGARLLGANLDGAQLLNADLTGADLSECRAERAHFGGARLAEARLFGANLSHATLTRADLRRADLRTARLAHARLRESDLRHAELTRTDLSGADLTGSDVTAARFVEADLSESCLNGLIGHLRADWIGARIERTDFHGALLVRRTIADQNYLHEFRRQSHLHEWIYRVWWLTSDCGRSLLRWGGWVAIIAVVFAALFSRVAVDYGAHESALSSLYFSVVTLTTLGYGDVLPASAAAQTLAMIEVGLGYMMLGGLLSIFANKMARRAD